MHSMHSMRTPGNHLRTYAPTYATTYATTYAPQATTYALEHQATTYDLRLHTDYGYIRFAAVTLNHSVMSFARYIRLSRSATPGLQAAYAASFSVRSSVSGTEGLGLGTPQRLGFRAQRPRGRWPRTRHVRSSPSRLPLKPET